MQCDALTWFAPFSLTPTYTCRQHIERAHPQAGVGHTSCLCHLPRPGSRACIPRGPRPVNRHAAWLRRLHRASTVTAAGARTPARRKDDQVAEGPSYQLRCRHVHTNVCHPQSAMMQSRGGPCVVVHKPQKQVAQDDGKD